LLRTKGVQNCFITPLDSFIFSSQQLLSFLFQLWGTTPLIVSL